MSMLTEFRDFAVKGNVVDLAVAVIIGAAFGKIVDSMVKDLIMPVVGWIFGGLDFSNYFVQLGTIRPDQQAKIAHAAPYSYKELADAGVAVWGYGSFITVLINFIILVFIIFWMVRLISAARRTPAAAPEPTPAPPEDVLLLRESCDSPKRP
ncbi:MAG: large conductance mechanosensitive channel protein MscL [Burkholderiaceae bacterium]